MKRPSVPSPEASNRYSVDCIGADKTPQHRAAWANLAQRALEPNVFLDPAFAIPAAQHVSGKKTPRFLMVWDGRGDRARPRLIGLLCLILPVKPYGVSIRTWRYPFSCLETPLLDKEQAALAFRLMLDWLRTRYPKAQALLLNDIASTGPTFAICRQIASAGRLSVAVIEERRRAILNVATADFPSIHFLSSKMAKETRRKLRRLKLAGDAVFDVATEGAALHEGIDAFMSLEARGWKGRQGDAILDDRGATRFLRVMAATLAADGKCRIYRLTVNGLTIAANILLLNGSGGAYFWKTAYDQNYGNVSPSVLLTLHMTSCLVNEQGIATVDSCATPNHSMINRLWRNQSPIACAMISLAEDPAPFFRFLLRMERWRRRARAAAKRILAR
jgi:CelD/BcsL family acetyltransferase involved in cellulose biosynthesis